MLRAAGNVMKRRKFIGFALLGSATIALIAAMFLSGLALHSDAEAFTHGKSGGSASTYDGLVATRGSAPSGKRSETQAMARTAFFTRGAVTQIKVIIPNWYNQELAPGSAATDTASIEYPLGTCTTLKKSGSATITNPNGGQVETDYATVSIPANTQAWYRLWSTNASGIVVQSFQGRQASLGDALIVGNSGVVDQTVSCGTVTDGGTFETIAPLAIIAPITAPSVCILGDSIALGVDNDHTPNSTGDNGSIAPSISPSFGYSNMAVNGETAALFVTTHTNRAAVLPYCSHTIVEYGTNDLYLNGDSVATLQARLTTIYGLAAPAVVFQSTLIARTDSSDFWVTTSGQSYPTLPIPNVEPLRVSFNSALTSASFGPNGGYFDPQSVVGTGTNNSIWKAVSGFPACDHWTQDGVHPTTCSYYTQLQGSGYIDLSRIHRP